VGTSLRVRLPMGRGTVSRTALPSGATVDNALIHYRDSVPRAGAGYPFGVDGDGRWTCLPETAAQLLGVTGDEREGLGDLLPGGNAAWQEAVAAVRRDGSFRFEGATGDRRWIVAVYAGASGDGLVGMVRDEDLLARLGQSIVEQDRMAFVGRALAAWAHTIRNKLAAIDNHLTLANSVSTPVVRREAALSNLARTLRPAFNEVSELLNMGIEAGSDTGAVDLATPFAEARRLAWHQLERSGIQLTFSVAEGTPAVTAPSHYVEHIVSLLVSNAANAFRHNGRPAGTLAVNGASGTPGVVVIRVRDDAGGVREGYEEMIFEPFFTTNPDRRAAGLGLSHARRLAESCGGTLILENQPGHGATFVLTLPAAPASAVTSAPVPSTTNAYDAVAPLRGSRILLVADNREYRDSTMAYLHTIHQPELITDTANVRDGIQAVAEAQAAGEPYHAILVDYRLPDGDGRQFFEHVAGSWPDLSHRVIVMTGDRIEGDLESFLAEHQVPHVGKLAGADVLAATVSAVIGETRD
jgi:signal transduction histidine kinase/CheY-like chemotaxis protein